MVTYVEKVHVCAACVVRACDFICGGGMCVCVCTFVCLGWVREGPRTRICDTFKKIKQERTIGNRQREG